jgi:hypothetical protein
MRALLAAALVMAGAGCAETHTIRELGHPEFEKVVGAETRFERVDQGEKRDNLVLVPEGADTEGDHHLLLMFVPDGSETDVGIDVRIAPRPGAKPLASLAVGVYPVSAQEAATFVSSGTGKLPAPENPMTANLVTEKMKESGAIAMRIVIPRDKLPPGAQKLACPVMARFEDGLVHLLFRETTIPEAVKKPDPALLLREYTVRELGQPWFEDLLGKDTKFQRADLGQEGGLDAIPSTAQDQADHRFHGPVVKAEGTKEHVKVDIRVKPREMKLTLLAPAAFPLSKEAFEAFAAKGTLPQGATPIQRVVERTVHEEGVLHALLTVRRADLPPGTEMLAVPSLLQFEDGWVHIDFLVIKVPPAGEGQ